MSRPRRAGGALSVLATAALALTGVPAAHASPVTKATTAKAPAAKPAAKAALDPRTAAEVSARSKARAIHQAVQVDALTTATSTTKANADGSFTTVTSTLPTRIRTKSGSWVDLDATLKKGPDGRVVMTTSQDALELSPGGTGPLVDLADGAGHEIALSLPFALPAPVLGGDTATYRNIEPGLDLTVTVQATGGFGEVFTVRTPAAVREAASITFATSLKDLVIKKDSAGDLAAVDARTGAIVMNAPVPAVWDSATDGHANAGAPDTVVSATVGASGPGTHSNIAKLPDTVTATGITLDSAAANLAHGHPVLPEYIDPTWTEPYDTGGIMNFTEVQQGCPSYNNYDSTSTEDEGLGVGNITTNSSCPGAYRAFYQDSLGGLNSSDTVISAYANFAEINSSQDACGVNEPISLDWTDGIPDPSGWNAQPGIVQTLVSGSVATVGYGDKCGTAYKSWQLPTSVMQNMANGNVSNLTWGLFGNEGTADTAERFAGNPTITINYDIKPNIPGALAASPVPTTSAGVGQPCAGSATGYLPMTNIGGSNVATLSAQLTSAVPSAQMQGEFTLVDNTADTTYNLTSSGEAASGATVSVQTPTLLSGHSYSWYLTSYDGYISSSVSATCTFTAVQNPPSNPSFSSTDFPPSGSTTGTTKRYGASGNNSGVITLTSTDTNGPGVAGFYYSIGTPVPTGGGTYVSATNGTASFTVTPGNWGTTTVYAQAADAAGNRSGSNQYSFYLPFSPGAKVVPGDMNGDSIPDLVTTGTTGTTVGDLLLHPGDSDPAAAPVVLSTPLYSPDAKSTPWNDYLVTHDGSFSNQGVDDLWAFDTVNDNLYLYKHETSNLFENTAYAVNITKTGIDQDSGAPGCSVTTTADCTGYDDTDWKNLTQIVAVGDLYAGSSLDVPNTNDIVTVEGDALWLYQGKNGPDYLAYPIKIGDSGWSGVTVMGPGTSGGSPALWARNNTTGVVTQYPITFDSQGYPKDLGTPATGGTQIANGITGAAYPSVVAAGDVLGNGNPDMYAIDPSGGLWFYGGTTGGSGPAPQHQWLLNEGTGSTINDSVGGLSGSVSSTGASWGTRQGKPDLNLDGESGYAETNGTAVNTAGSFTVSAWAELNSIPSTSSNYTVVSEFGSKYSPFYLQLNSDSWAFAISSSDTSKATINGASGPANVVTDTWYHITGVYNATTQAATIYVHGVNVGTQNNLPTWSATRDLDIGRDLYTELKVDYFPGQISDVETWNSALTDAQVAGLDATGGLSTTGSLAGSLSGR
jgi:Concanavalin A-like lectin/glucanases superfamily